MKQLIIIIFLYFGLNSFGQLNATITASDYEVCVGDTVLITMICGGGTNPYTLFHSVNGGAPLTIVAFGDTAYITEIYSGAGTYVYSLNEIQDSQGNVTQLNSSISVVVNPLPTATLMGDTIVCVGDPNPIVTFTGADGTSPYVFVYQINHSSPQTIMSTGDIAEFFIPTMVEDTFVITMLQVDDANICGQEQFEEITVIVENCAGIMNVENGQIDIFPNPTYDELTINGVNISGNERVRVLDAKGKVVLEGVLSSGSIHISSIQSGIYFLEIQDHVQSRVRFIKE